MRACLPFAGTRAAIESPCARAKSEYARPRSSASRRSARPSTIPGLRARELTVRVEHQKRAKSAPKNERCEPVQDQTAQRPRPPVQPAARSQGFAAITLTFVDGL